MLLNERLGSVGQRTADGNVVVVVVEVGGG